MGSLEKPAARPALDLEEPNRSRRGGAGGTWSLCSAALRQIWWSTTPTRSRDDDHPLAVVRGCRTEERGGCLQRISRLFYVCSSRTAVGPGPRRRPRAHDDPIGSESGPLATITGGSCPLLVSYSATVLVQLLVYTQRSNGATASLITHHFTRGSNYKGIAV